MRVKGLLTSTFLTTLIFATAALGQSSASLLPAQERSVPAYLPRTAFVGVMASRDLVTPQLRLAWEWKFLEQGDDMLAFVVEGGGGYSVVFPDPRMTFFYQHHVLAGVGYLGRRFERFRWGVQVLTGPMFYGSRISGFPNENRITGNLEGRARIGWDVGPVTVGASAGFASMFSRPPRSVAAQFGGGFIGGLFVDWWH